jgi:hypothetical protein
MSEQDRGAYAPPNETPLAFDPRHDGERRGPAPLALIVSALVLIALVAGLVVFYRHGVRKPGQPPQVVGAPIGDTKSAPLSSEAPADATAGLQVYKTETPPPGEGQVPAASAPSLAPAPEEPQARPIARAAPVAPVAVTPLRAAEPAPPPVVIRQAAIKPVAAKPLPAAAPESAAPAVVKAPVLVKAAKPAALLAASSAKPAKPPKPAPVAVAKATSAPVVAAASGGGTTVQIGAFSSQALAEKGWSDAAHAVPGAAGKTRKFESVSKDGKTFTRAYVGGFASHADAVAFCSALKAAGKPCFVK